MGHPAVIRILAFIALFLATSAAADFGQVGGGIGRIWVGIDSFNNAGEIKKSVAFSLNIPESQVWTAGNGGSRVINVSTDATQCEAGDGYPYFQCSAGVYAIEHLDGQCRYWADLHPLLPQDNSFCVGVDDPLNCCSGSGTGDCNVACWEDVGLGNNDYAIIQSSVNDVRGVPSGYCTGAFFEEHKVGWQDMLDHASAQGVRVVIATSVMVREEPQFSNSHNLAQECIRDWLRDTLLPANSDHTLVDVYGIWEQYGIDHGIPALLGLYANCPSEGADTSFDCVHPGAGPNSLGDNGVDFIAQMLAGAIQQLHQRRLNE